MKYHGFKQKKRQIPKWQKPCFKKDTPVKKKVKKR